MAYQKTVWKDQDVENPRTYVERDNGDGTVTLLDAFGTVTELGTPVNATNMNHIEDGIEAVENSIQPKIDTSISAILAALYPVGSIYIGTQSTCPLATLISGSQWQLVAQDRALWGGDGSNAHRWIAAGLPNITGEVAIQSPWTSASENGALKTTTQSGSFVSGQTSQTWTNRLYFDASRSNSIYGNSNTVQPPAYVVNVWRRTA